MASGAAAAGAVAGLAAFFIPTPAGDVRDGTFPNNPGMSYHWDEGELTLSHADATGQQVEVYRGRADPDGNYRDASGAILGTATPSGFAVDPSVLENRRGDGGGAENTGEQEEKPREYKKPIPGLSGKAGSKDAPSWVKGELPYVDENGKEFAKRLCDKKYGPGNYKTRTGTDYNKIKKLGDRNFK